MANARPERDAPQTALRASLELAAAVALIFVLGDIALRVTALSRGIMVIWPVDGLILALMLGPFRRRPFQLLVAAKAAVMVGEVCGGSRVLLAFGLPIGSAIGTYLIYWVLRRSSTDNSFTRSRGLLIFLGAAGLASMLTGVVGSCLFYLVKGSDLLSVFLTNSAANAVGYAVITPLLLILVRRDPRVSLHANTETPGRLVAVAYCALVFAVFAQSRYPLLYLIPLGLMLVAYTADLAVVAVVVSITVFIAIAFTLVGCGPFQLTPAELPERIFMLQMFLAVLTAAALPMAALMAEHKRLKLSLVGARIEAEAANQAKSVFLATMSHEIRTPLNGVLGMVQVMAMDELSERQRGRIDVVRKSGESLLALLNDVLDLSKIEAGKIVLETLEFDMGELLQGALSNFQGLAQEKGLSLALDLGDAAGLYRGDPTRIRQILHNLISNALKFTSSGSIGVTAELRAEGVSLSVSDTGMGIPADKLDTVFAKFSQVDASTTRRFGGTGLGLSICRELAQLMGGDMGVRSVEGQGSTFTLVLPLERVGDAPVTAAPPAPEEASVGVAGLRVLAAEDNPTNQLVLKSLLEYAGVDVVMVENGQMAVEAWEAGVWDLVLMDVQMPVMDGPTATKIIRAREAALGRPRTLIVALTANTLSHQVEAYLAAGMDAHLGKPIEVAALFETLSRAADPPDPGPGLDRAVA